MDKNQQDEYQAVPVTVLKVAFQPTARGGAKHHVAGNIRLVFGAKELLDANVQETIPTCGWMIAHRLEDEAGDEWQAWLEHKYHIDGNNRGHVAEEQLLIEGQEIYVCPMCLGDSFL